MHRMRGQRHLHPWPTPDPVPKLRRRQPVHTRPPEGQAMPPVQRGGPATRRSRGWRVKPIDQRVPHHPPLTPQKASETPRPPGQGGRVREEAHATTPHTATAHLDALGPVPPRPATTHFLGGRPRVREEARGRVPEALRPHPEGPGPALRDHSLLSGPRCRSEGKGREGSFCVAGAFCT